MKRLDRTLLLAIITIMGIGLVQVYSSSYIHAIETRGDGLYFLKRQLAFCFGAICMILLFSRIKLDWIKKATLPVYIFATLALAATLVPGLGIRAGGAIRWLNLPMGFVFEPSEFFKIALSLGLAYMLCHWEKWSNGIRSAATVLFFAPFLILLKQPDFGTFALGLCLIFMILFVYGLRSIYIFASLIASIPAFYFLVWRVPYRRMRVNAFVDPWSDPATKGFQIIQSLSSLQNGGLTGVGLGQSQGKLFFLPEAHTDFTLAIFGEESGLIGIALILFLFCFLMVEGLRLVWKVQDRFWRAATLGLISMFSLSVLVNFGVVIGLLPTKGLSLPFISYGGSSLLMQGVLFGIILNVKKTFAATPWKS